MISLQTGSLLRTVIGVPMKRYLPAAALLLGLAGSALLLFGQTRPAPALDGEPYIHDPSTIMFSDGKYYTYGTGEGGIWTATSADGKAWTLGASISGVAAADPGTARLKDGTLLIVGTGPPRPGTPGAQRRPPTPRPKPSAKDAR